MINLNLTKSFGVKPKVNTIAPIAEQCNIPSLLFKGMLEAVNSATRKGAHNNEEVVNNAIKIDKAIMEEHYDKVLNKMDTFLSSYIDCLSGYNKLNRIPAPIDYATENILEKTNKMVALLAMNGIISIHNAIDMLGNDKTLLNLGKRVSL